MPIDTNLLLGGTPPPARAEGAPATTGGVGGGGAVAPEYDLYERPQRSTVTPNNPDATAARITREQWQHFLDTYRPVEEQALARAIQTDFTTEGNEAGATARSTAQAAKGMLARSMSRSGAQLTAEERTAVARRQNLSMTKAEGRAENTTRRGLSDSRTQLLAESVSIGRGVMNTASAGAQSVADMAAQRELQHQQQKTATQNANMSMAATAAALMISWM